jgi:exodeoxyribonuclease VII large subunit
MSEVVNNQKVFTLLEVMKSIQKTLDNRYSSPFWVKAEMHKLNFYRHSGHCYPDLIEKKDGKVIAQLRANLWATDYQKINRKFLAVLNEPLKDGTKIMFEAKITFDAVYGLSLNILDIDPCYTLGDLEIEKINVIRQLKDENLFMQNKSLSLPLLPQRIAIISVETSKGYADFVNVIENNPWGYKFAYCIFPSLLQSEKAVQSIIGQLNRIKEVMQQFDIVAIIRGGGGEVGLSCYNNYLLAKAICTFPLPVLTGIGHATNETVCEMVAFENAITPTKLADYLIQKFHNFAHPLKDFQQKITAKALRLLEMENATLQSQITYIQSLTEKINLAQKNNLQRLQNNFFQQLSFKLEQQCKQLDFFEKNIQLLNPQNVLKRGYSITMLDNQVLQNAAQLKKGTQIKTILQQGEIESIVETIK